MVKAEKKRRGRPPKEEWAMKQVAVRFPIPMLVEIDAEREAKLDRPERAAEIRALVAEGLGARRARREAMRKGKR